MSSFTRNHNEPPQIAVLVIENQKRSLVRYDLSEEKACFIFTILAQTISLTGDSLVKASIHALCQILDLLFDYTPLETTHFLTGGRICNGFPVTITSAPPSRARADFLLG
jgi:hypothetical protein